MFRYNFNGVIISVKLLFIIYSIIISILIIFSEIISGIVSRERSISMLWQGSIDQCINTNVHINQLLGEALLICRFWFSRAVLGAVWDSGLPTNSKVMLILKCRCYSEVEMLSERDWNQSLLWRSHHSGFEIREATVFFGGGQGEGWWINAFSSSFFPMCSAH